MNKPTKGYFGDILLLCLLAFPLRLAALFQTPYANGWDAYFYLIQIKSWIEEGAMHSSDSSLIYPMMRLIHWFSVDYVLNFKITSAFLATAFVVLIYIWGRKTASYGIAILLTFYFLWSPHLTWFAAQYPKNLLGVNLLLLFFIVLKKGERTSRVHGQLGERNIEENMSSVRRRLRSISTNMPTLWDSVILKWIKSISTDMSSLWDLVVRRRSKSNPTNTSSTSLHDFSDFKMTKSQRDDISVEKNNINTNSKVPEGRHIGRDEMGSQVLNENNSKWDLGKILITGLLLLANYFGHRMTFVLSGIYFVIYFFEKIISQNFYLENAFQYWKKGLMFFVGVLFLFLIVTPFFSGTLSFLDLERISGAFSNQPHFAPLTFFNEYNEGNRLSLFWKIEIGMSVLFYFVGVLLLFLKNLILKDGLSPPLEGMRWLLLGAKQKSTGGWLFAMKEKSTIKQPPPNPLQRGRSTVEQFALFILCSILIFPFLKWSLTSMSFRLVLVFIFLSPMFFILALKNFGDNYKSNIISLRKKSLKKPVDINPLFSLLKSRGADLYPRFLSILLKFITPVSILLLVLSFFSWKSYNPELHDAPYEKYDRVTQATSDFFKNKNPELVIAHNALAEYFTFTTGIDALPWQPEYKIAEDKLWRIAADVRLPIFRTFLSEEDFKNLKRIGVNYYLIQESVWQKFKDNLLKNNELAILKKINTWRNPYRVRPNFLLQKKKKQDE